MPEIPENQENLEEIPGEEQASGGENAVPGEDSPVTESPDECDELEKTTAQLKDQLLRKAAEFDNFKKRTEAEMALLVRFANEDLVEKLLPVLDDFERSFKALGFSPDSDTRSDGQEQSGKTPGDERDQKEDAFIHGVRLIYAKFRKILDQVGVKAFDSAGKPFDPELHDALLQVPRMDLPHHTVVEEIEKGYLYHEKVIRHARVIVSSNSGGSQDETDVKGRKSGD